MNTYKIEGMHCANCARRVEEALNNLETVQAKVDLAEDQVQVDYNRQVTTLEDLQAAVDSLGYSLIIE